MDVKQARKQFKSAMKMMSLTAKGFDVNTEDEDGYKFSIYCKNTSYEVKTFTSEDSNGLPAILSVKVVNHNEDGCSGEFCWVTTKCKTTITNFIKGLVGVSIHEALHYTEDLAFLGKGFKAPEWYFTDEELVTYDKNLDIAARVRVHRCTLWSENLTVCG